MKKDIQKLTGRILVIFAALFLLWLHFALKDPLSYVDQDAAACIWVKNFAASCHDPASEVLILGDSLSNCAFLPNFLPGKVASVCLGGSSPVQEYFILRRYLDNNIPPRICFLSFSDQIFNSSAVFLTPATSWLYTFSEVLEIKTEGKRLGQKAAASPPYPAWEFYCLSPRIFQLSIMRGFFSKRKESNRNFCHHADIHAGAYMQPVTASFGAGELCRDHFSVTPMVDNYYRKMIELCISRGVQVKIVKLPSHPAVRYTENYRREFTDYYRKLKSDYPEITIDWFEYELDEDCFVDTIGHMNLKGGCLFSRMLARYYPDVFDTGTPLSNNLIEGIEEYIQSDFDSDQAIPSSMLTNVFR